MIERIIKNWKSTLAGLSMGFIEYLMLVDYNFTWKSFVAIGLPVLWGAVSKDTPKTNEVKP